MIAYDNGVVSRLFVMIPLNGTVPLVEWKGERGIVLVLVNV